MNHMRKLVFTGMWVCLLPGLVAASTAASPPLSQEPICQNKPPSDFKDLKDAIPGVSLDIRYHTPHNFTGSPLPGYGAPGAWLRTEAAQALALVQQDLAKKNLGLVIFDAYRPARATRAMVSWAIASGNSRLLNGYIARRSRHNRGVAVDLGLVDLTTHTPLDMGSPFDDLSEKSHTANARGETLVNRLLLKKAMELRGFKNYHREWWHYEHPLEHAAERDVPYGCGEPPESPETH